MYFYVFLAHGSGVFLWNLKSLGGDKYRIPRLGMLIPCSGSLATWGKEDVWVLPVSMTLGGKDFWDVEAELNQTQRLLSGLENGQDLLSKRVPNPC